VNIGDLLRWLLLLLAIALTALISARASRVLYFQPLRSRARPVTSYAEALARVEYLRTHLDESLPIKDACKPYLLSHGEKTKRVVVYYHGFTNCPKQFVRLGQIFFEKGYNVLVPRMPYHGLQDRTQMRNLTAEGLARELDDTIDIARGLGEEVIVIGLSGGGTMATWAAQFRQDVERAILIAPLLSVPYAPPSVVYLFDVLLLLLPNWWVWWDPIKKEKRDWGVPHAYPGYATHAQAQTMRLGLSALKATKASKPAA
jgi:alpha-beta hydrolase superfamily lysophospholipase